jgi:hypothetical protein
MPGGLLEDVAILYTTFFDRRCAMTRVVASWMLVAALCGVCRGEEQRSGDVGRGFSRKPLGKAAVPPFADDSFGRDEDQRNRSTTHFRPHYVPLPQTSAPSFRPPVRVSSKVATSAARGAGSGLRYGAGAAAAGAAGVAAAAAARRKKRQQAEDKPGFTPPRFDLDAPPDSRES